jgi:hypothetical protein
LKSLAWHSCVPERAEKARFDWIDMAGGDKFALPSPARPLRANEDGTVTTPA